MRNIPKIQIILHSLIGIGALAGGLAAILNPVNPLGITLDALNGYFDSFFIPGLFLFFIIGIGNLVGAVLYRLPCPVQGYTSGFMGAVLFLWIIIQCYILQAVAVLHVIFGFLGIIQGALALIMLAEKRMFPFNMVINVMQKIREPKNRNPGQDA